MSAVRIFLTGFRPSISALRDDLAEQPGVFVTGAAGTMSESSRRLREENPDVVVHAVFGSAMLEEEIESIREVTQAPIVLLAEDEDPTLLDEALHTDVADVVLLPQTAERVAFTVRNAARRAAAHEAAGPKRALVVTVFSPKGGTGKTVVSTQSRGRGRQAARGAHAAGRSRPAVRRRRDHAGAAAGADTCTS